jgi:RimJ/RimL family protein N-acetyltransferase
MAQRKYDFVEVTLEPDDYEKVKEVYRLHKEQANKIFGLSSGVSTDEDIMECIRDNIDANMVLLAIDTTNGKYAAMVGFDNIIMYDGTVANMRCHIIVNKRYWGQESRHIIFDWFEYAKENMKPIKRLEAFVPSNNFGIIKLLKDVGFKIEGTLKDRVIYKNKDGVPTYYNELVYSKLNIGV